MDLPPVGADDGDWVKPRSFAQGLAEVIFGCLFLAWFCWFRTIRFCCSGPEQWYLKSLPYQLAPVWWTFYWWLVAINAFELTWKIVDLARGAWQRPKNRAKHLAMHALSLIPLSVLLLAPKQQLFLLKNPADAAKLGGALAIGEQGSSLGLDDRGCGRGAANCVARRKDRAGKLSQACGGIGECGLDRQPIRARFGVFRTVILMARRPISPQAAQQMQPSGPEASPHIRSGVK